MLVALEAGMAITRAQAFCAIGPDGLIDIDMIRRGTASCHHAASNITGTPWPQLRRAGWEVHPVRIVLEEDVDAPEERAAAAQPAGPVQRPAKPVHRSAAATSGKVRVLRCDQADG